MNQTSTSGSINNKENIKQNATPTSVFPSSTSIRKDGNIIKPKSILTNASTRPSRVRDNCDDVTPLGGVLANLSLRPPCQNSIKKKVYDNDDDEISQSSSDSDSDESSDSSDRSENSNSDCSDSSCSNSETTESIQSSYYKSLCQSNDTQKSNQVESIEEPLHSTTAKLFPTVNNNNVNNNEKEIGSSSTGTSTSINKKRKSNIFASPKPPTSQVSYQQQKDQFQFASPLAFGKTPTVLHSNLKSGKKEKKKHKVVKSLSPYSSSSCTVEAVEVDFDLCTDDESSVEIKIYKSKSRKHCNSSDEDESYKEEEFDEGSDDDELYDQNTMEDDSYIIQEPYIPYGKDLNQLDSACKKFIKNELLCSDEDGDEDEEDSYEEDSESESESESENESESEIESEISITPGDSDTETEDDESKSGHFRIKRGFVPSKRISDSSSPTASMSISREYPNEASSLFSEEKSLEENQIDVEASKVDSSIDDETQVTVEAQLVDISRQKNRNEDDEERYSSDSDHESSTSSTNHKLYEKKTKAETDAVVESSTSKSISNGHKSFSRQTSTTSIGNTRNVGKVRRGKWSLGSRIGEGSFGVVYVGMNNLTGNLMAVKSLHIPISSPKDIMVDLKREIDLMQSFEHQNIVRYIGSEMDSSRNVMYIFQEWVTGGSVVSLLNKFGAFPITVVRSYLHQILCGLEYLHSNRILHRDIKGGNVLVNDEGVVKLADFGASKKMHVTKNGTLIEMEDLMEQMTVRGTPYYMAPEVFEGTFSVKADVWSAGGVAYQMLTGCPPWKGMGLKSPTSLFMHLQKSSGHPPMEEITEKEDRSSPSSSLNTTYTEFQQMLTKCFERDASKRPTVQTLLQDTFFRENSCNDSLLDDDSLVDSSCMNVLAPYLSPVSPEKLYELQCRKKEGGSIEDKNKKCLNMKDWPSWAQNGATSSLPSTNPFARK